MERRVTHFLARLGLVGALVCGAHGLASAQATPARVAPATRPPPPTVVHVDRQEARTLAGHRFVPLRTVVSPFIAWRVATNTDASLSDIEVEVEDPRGPNRPPLGRLDGKLAVVTESFQLSTRIFPWLGLRGQLLAGVASGVDRDGAIEIGANGTYGFSLGGSLRLLHSRRAMLTFDFEASVMNIQGLKPRLLLDSIPAEGEPVVTPEVKLTFAGRSIRSAPSLALGLALTRWLGVQASGTYARRRINTSIVDAVESLVEGGLGVSFTPGPVTLLFGGRVTRELRSDQDSPIAALEPQDRRRGEIEGGLYYSGRPALDLGLVVTRVVGPTDQRLRGGLTLAYYW
jgi:hypothetical protein